MYPKVINLSKKTLSDKEIELLKHGLKFTPTPNEDDTELQTDIKELCRKLRLAERFANTDNEPYNEPLVRNKTGWNPPKSHDAHLEDAIQYLKEYPRNENKNVKNNISREEKSAMKSLLADNSIIIKEADKGGAVVVMDTLYYRDKMREMLADTEFYSETDEKADTRTRKQINQLVDQFEDELMEEESEYLRNFEHSTSYYYGLPKIHKCEEIETAIKENNSEYIHIPQPKTLKFRPIVGGPNSATQRLSHLIDLILKPLCKQVPSFVRDDLDFLNTLPTCVENSSKLITFDVVNLYTNIPHDLGIKAIEFWLQNCELERQFDKDFILNGLKLILEGNVFYFDGKYYVQKKGTAMGTKMAPTYATLVLGYLENILYDKVGVKYGNEVKEYLITNWKRFLDDCFVIETRLLNSHDLHTELNDLQSGIMFTMNESDTEMPFLDILVQKEGETITTDLYSKPTDTHNYLNFKSCHPKHTKLNIPFNLASRIITIVRDHNTQVIRLMELQDQLLEQNYPLDVIKQGFARARQKGPITTPIQREQHQKYNVIPFVHTYNPRNQNMTSAIKTSRELLQRSDTMKTVLENKNIINSKRQPKNLKRILTKSKFDFQNKTPCVTKCNRSRCKTCPDIMEGTTISFSNGKTFHVKTDMSCVSKQVVYSIICAKCNAFYIGQTKNELCKRMTLHRQQTNHEELRVLNVNKHIHSCAGGKFKIFPLYRVDSANVHLLEEKEQILISALKPQLNSSSM